MANDFYVSALHKRIGDTSKDQAIVEIFTSGKLRHEILREYSVSNHFPPEISEGNCFSQ